MKTSIPWLRVVAEGVVIVISILLAFGIDAWWDSRNAALAERALLGDVVEELGQVVEVLDAAGAIHDVHRQAAQTLIDDGESPDNRETARAISNLLGFVTLDVSTGALEAALSTDGLGRIASDSTRTLLARWPGMYLDLIENEALEMELVEHTLHPMLRTLVSVPDLAAFAGQAGPTQNRTEPGVRAVRDRARLMRDLEAMRSDRELQGLYFQFLLNDTGVLEQYEELRQLSLAIIESAERSIR